MAVTSRLNLRKPALGDNVDLETDWNENWDKIDDATRYNQDETIPGDWTFSGKVAQALVVATFATLTDGGTTRSVASGSF